MVTRRQVYQVNEHIESAMERLKAAPTLIKDGQELTYMAYIVEVMQRDLQGALEDLEYMLEVAD